MKFGSNSSPCEKAKQESMPFSCHAFFDPVSKANFQVTPCRLESGGDSRSTDFGWIQKVAGIFVAHIFHLPIL